MSRTSGITAAATVGQVKKSELIDDREKDSGWK